jgi:hypothetical protein
MLAVEKRTSAMTTASATRSGWRKPAVVFERTRSGKETRAIANAFRCHGGLTPAALRKRAFVHRECRYFSTDRRRAPGAAGVSQPWETLACLPLKNARLQ